MFMSKSPDDGAVPAMQTALPRCITTLRCCIKNANEHVSAVIVWMRHPSCRKKSIADSPMAPKVAMAISVKLYSGDRLLYFDFFLYSASVATAPGPTTAPIWPVSQLKLMCAWWGYWPHCVGSDNLQTYDKPDRGCHLHWLVHHRHWQYMWCTDVCLKA